MTANKGLLFSAAIKAPLLRTVQCLSLTCGLMKKMCEFLKQNIAWRPSSAVGHTS